MIIRKRTHWIKMLFIWKGSILSKVMPQLMIIFAFSIVVFLLHGKVYDIKIQLNPAIFTLIGVSLAIFLGFCNTASYDRYWEGRKLWGKLVNDTRSLTRQILTIVETNDQVTIEKKQEFVKMISAFCWALNYELRGKTETDQLERLLSKEQVDFLKQCQFKPVMIMNMMGEWLNEMKNQKAMDSMVLTTLDFQLNQLSEIVGGCERILNTPVPFVYHVLLHRTVYIYCFLLPYGLVDAVGWMMPVLVLFISYTFISLDAVVDEIGEPFGEEANDLALNAICRTIEFSIFEQARIPQQPLNKSTDYFID